MLEFRIFVLTMAENFSIMILTSSYKIMTLYINAHALYSPTEWVSKRKSRHLLEVVHASLFGVNMPQSFWGEAVVSAAYLIHRIPSSILNFQTPLQTLHHYIQTPPTPNMEPRIFGYVVFVHLHDHQRSKLDHRVEKCVFIGYAPHQK
ncbi:hypothetical protein L3X38_024754 [Prunus dulcis]|uniref:Retroviral polymerase SH3-like domain-containing protein n=1 Tax=Prunus dulcis TaxID=3755 RepID=A0AAD4W2X6_PRUDU|nr:hypothetical protein L3X38_024754 [Prunus dulcis]